MKYSTLKKTIAAITAAAAMIPMFTGFIPVPFADTDTSAFVETVQAATVSMADLRNIFPHNSYWNGSYLNRAWQCHGWALTCGYKLTGVDPYKWSKYSSASSIKNYINSGKLKPGDIIRVGNNRHTILVTGVSGSTITYADCNWTRNTVKWDNTVTVSGTASKFGSTTYKGINYILSAPGNVNPDPAPAPAPQPQPNGQMQTSADNSSIDKMLFDPDLYYALYPDLQRVFGKNYNTLYNHWVNCGRNEGRTASVFFDAKYYLAANPDVARAYGATNYAMAYNHFVSFGIREGRAGSKYFSAAVYRGLYPDLKNAFGTNYLALMQHFNSFSYYGTEMRASSSNCNIGNYKARYTDLRNAFGNSYGKTYFIHLLQHGVHEGRSYK